MFHSSSIPSDEASDSTYSDIDRNVHKRMQTENIPIANALATIKIRLSYSGRDQGVKPPFARSIRPTYANEIPSMAYDANDASSSKLKPLAMMVKGGTATRARTNQVRAPFGGTIASHHSINKGTKSDPSPNMKLSRSFIMASSSRVTHRDSNNLTIRLLRSLAMMIVGTALTPKIATTTATNAAEVATD